ncbi:hypothetical protein MTO96_052400 [Rhipicephalus appendiculatus]
MAASARMPLDAGRDDTDGMDCRDADAHDLATSRDSNTSDAGGPRQRELDGDWQIALTLRQRKAQARERKQKTPDHPDTSSQPLPSDGRTQERPRKKPKYRRLPPLPRDDFKVIVRPHQGLPIKSLTSPALADAVIAACGGLITGEQFLLRIKPGSNIFIVSTPHQEVAEKVSRIARLIVNGRPHAVNAYVATGEGATRGVIHGLQPHTPSEEIKANLRVRTQGVEVLQARMLGDTKTAVITFYGGLVPRCVYYRGGELPCYPYKNTTQVCKVCYHVGHRSDVCPQPDTRVCRICGMRDPVPSHECSPKCATCGEDHLTGDRTCKKRLKPLRHTRYNTSNKQTSNSPRGQATTKTKKHLQWFSSDAEDLDMAWPSLPPCLR